MLATPHVLALAERATVAAVGTRVELDHLVPSPVGAELEVTAVLERVVGRRLEFAVRVADGDRPVARGRIAWVVETAGFLRRAAADAGAAR